MLAPMSGIRPHAAAILLSCIGLVLWSAEVAGQTTATPAPEVESAEDPTTAVFFSVRNELFNLADASWTNALIFRFDRVVLRSHPRLGGKTGLLTRFDVPIVATERGGVSEAGLGDLYAQALYVPWLSRRFALAVGSGLSIPTATDPLLGTKKWKAAPVGAPVWFFPRGQGFFLVRVQEHVSFAGNDERTDLNHLEVVPVLFWKFTRNWWTLVDTNTLIDFENNNRISRSTGIEVGRVLRRSWGLALKPEIPWGPNPRGDWKLIAILTRYRVR
jgi:hypothetical protein